MGHIGQINFEVGRSIEAWNINPCRREIEKNEKSLSWF